MDNFPVSTPILPQVPPLNPPGAYSPNPVKTSTSKANLFVWILLLFVLTVGLVLGVLLVKRRQELKKKAVVGPGMYGCGLRVNPLRGNLLWNGIFLQ